MMQSTEIHEVIRAPLESSDRIFESFASTIFSLVQPSIMSSVLPFLPVLSEDKINDVRLVQLRSIYLIFVILLVLNEDNSSEVRLEQQ